MDIDLEDQLRSEIDDLRYEVEELRDTLNLLRNMLLSHVNQPSPAVKSEVPKKYTWVDSTERIGINSDAQHQQAEAAKNQRLSHFVDAMKYAGTYIDKDEWAKQWQYALNN